MILQTLFIFSDVENLRVKLKEILNYDLFFPLNFPAAKHSEVVFIY
jgi:hypothetical protein